MAKNGTYFHSLTLRKVHKPCIYNHEHALKVCDFLMLEVKVLFYHVHCVRKKDLINIFRAACRSQKLPGLIDAALGGFTFLKLPKVVQRKVNKRFEKFVVYYDKYYFQVVKLTKFRHYQFWVRLQQVEICNAMDFFGNI